MFKTEAKPITRGLITGKVRKRSFVISALLTVIIAVTLITNKAISSNPYDSHHEFVESVAARQADRKPSIDIPNNSKGQYNTVYPYEHLTAISKAPTLSY
ncbi:MULTISPECIES: hypothetical protein [Gibbsiella]|uniref:Uncharacterized protein n=1 Tax=Gibbsiella dentisursi TaxID=796890 RepID=A0ABP7KS14_9GAMM|nr:hypothetical protein [Gibbsiella quercinecans]